MSYKLYVKQYGKIEEAEIELLPLTLFVGDNNSGKSYLLSLIWAFSNDEQKSVIFRQFKYVIRNQFEELYNGILSLINSGDLDESVVIMEQDIFTLLNTMLELNKDNLVNNIFNRESMSVGEIKVISDTNRVIRFTKANGDANRLIINVEIDEKMVFSVEFAKVNDVYEVVTMDLLRFMAEYFLSMEVIRKESCYLPAARTGFMLAKNIINRVGRKTAFDFIISDDEEDIVSDSPFPKTILHFLECIENLDMQKETKKYFDLVEWISNNMSKGQIKCIDTVNNNVQYVPDGMEQGIPLRASSAVVTELTPLILLLKHSKTWDQICYEEPEMCLHPKLQLQMAKVLLRMVNKDINMIVTTHSDIIVQHINNMCKLDSVLDYDKHALEKIGVELQDIIDTSKVAIYQFKDMGNNTIVERINAQNNNFKVPLFTDALSEILEQTMEIYELAEEKEE